MTDTLTIDEAAAELADKYKQWVIGPGPRRSVLTQSSFREGSQRNYNLKGLAEDGDFLQWEHQHFGINLGWTGDHSASTATRVSRWFFARSGSGTGPLTYGETIAMGYGTDPSFIYYTSRTVGINLGWSSKPVFEWKVLGQPKGRPVQCGDRVAIHNAKAGSATVPGVLIAFDRTVGGDIGWPDSKTWVQQGQDILLKQAKDQVTKLVMAKLGGA
jgi:hypothetical protein